MRATSFEPMDCLRAGEVGYITASIKNGARSARSAIRSRAWTTPRRSRCRATARYSPWCSAASTPRTARTTRTCGTRWKNCSSTTRHSPLSRRPPWRWASASAAASWGFCTWRSSRSAWSANTTWTSSPPRRASSTTSRRPTATVIAIDNPTNYPDPALIAAGRRAHYERAYLLPKRVSSATSWSFARSAAACSRI